MSLWTHNICAGCWREREGYRRAVRLASPPMEVCCFCGRTNSDGIYARENGRTLRCEGNCDA